MTRDPLRPSVVRVGAGSRRFKWTSAGQTVASDSFCRRTDTYTCAENGVLTMTLTIKCLNLEDTTPLSFGKNCCYCTANVRHSQALCIHMSKPVRLPDIEE